MRGDAPNTRTELEKRRAAGAITWVVAAMLFARPIFAVIAQGLVAALLALQGSDTPWRDAAPWLPIYATLIDLGCPAALWLLMRREGGKLIDLIGFERGRLGRDVLLGLALIPPSLMFILGGNGVSSLLVYGTLAPPAVFQPLPPLATLYAILVFPLLWGFTEQMTYNGYLAPRLQVLTRSTAMAVALVAFPWSFQHAVLPVTFDSSWMIYRTLSPIPFSVFAILIYFRMRRIVPLAVAHWLMDGAAVFMSSLWPLLR